MLFFFILIWLTPPWMPCPCTMYLPTDISLGKAYYWIVVVVNFCKCLFINNVTNLTL